MSNGDWWLKANVLVAKVQAVAEEAAGIGEAMFHARNGTAIEKGLAGVQIVSSVFGFLTPRDEKIHTKLSADGWVPFIQWENTEPVQNILNQFATQVPITVMSWASEGEASMWLDDDGNPIAIHIQTMKEVLYERSEGAIGRFMRSKMWGDGRPRMYSLSMEMGNKSEIVTIGEYILPDDPIVGRQAAEAHQKINAWSGRSNGRTRVGTIVGPTGSGKSSIAVSAFGDESKVVVFRYDRSKPTVAITVLKAMAPDVVVIDDVPFSNSIDTKLMALIEGLASTIPNLILTFMDDRITAFDDAKPGCLYWPAFRPGRVDWMLMLLPPDFEDRTEILDAYGVGEYDPMRVAQCTEGLTPAFLKEIARRLAEGDELEDTVRLLRLQAPKGMSRVEEEEHQVVEEGNEYDEDDDDDEEEDDG